MPNKLDDDLNYEFIKEVHDCFIVGEEYKQLCDKKLHIKVISELFEHSVECGLFPAALTRSPITGGDGNTEYLVCFVKNGKQNVCLDDIKKCVMEEN